MVVVNLWTVQKWKVMARMIIDSCYDDNRNPDKRRHNVDVEKRKRTNHWDKIAEYILDWVAVSEIDNWHWGV